MMIQYIIGKLEGKSYRRNNNMSDEVIVNFVVLNVDVK